MYQQHPALLTTRQTDFYNPDCIDSAIGRGIFHRSVCIWCWVDQAPGHLARHMFMSVEEQAVPHRVAGIVEHTSSSESRSVNREIC